MDKTGFAAFPEEAVDFLLALKANNNREWFNSHKGDYKNFLQEPANRVCGAMAQNLLELTGYEHRSKVFRLYRDLRFSKDKTPYNCHLHISFIPEIASVAALPCWFFGFEPGQLTVGAGIFGFEKDILDSYRRRVGSAGEELQAMLDLLEGKGFRLGEIELKRVPKPYAQDHEYAELLKRKGLSAWYDFADPMLACQPALIEQCMEQFTQTQPLFDWLLTLEPSGGV